jgi:predicted amidophosphoribosyltransferase
MNMINCPTCGAQVPAGAAFCDNCGASLAGVVGRPGAGAAGNQQRCPTCGESVMPGEAFCGNCGTPLSSAAPTAYVPSSPPPQSPPAWSPPPPPPAAPQSRPQGSAAPSTTVGMTCSNCGSPVQPTDVFCDNCGQALTSSGSGFPASPQIPADYESDPLVAVASSAPAAASAPAPPPAPAMPVQNPRLIVQSSGATLNLAAGKNEYLIGREDPVSGSFPDVDLVPYGGEEGGVSRRHAQIARNGGQFSIEDLNSVNYTFVNRQKVAPGAPHPLQDGDEIRLGRVVLQFKTS